MNQVYCDRLAQIERYDKAGFFAYHLAEHHTPAVHSLAPSQNVFLAAASQRTKTIRLSPCIYVLPLHHPLRLIEEICMLDHLSNGRLEIGVGRGGLLEAYFWGSDSDVERNYAKYIETLEIVRTGLSNDVLSFDGQFYNFDKLPMRLRPKQQPHPPMWYMRNVEIAAREGMNSIIVGTIEGFGSNVRRFWEEWELHQGKGAKTPQGEDPKIGLVNHIVISRSESDAIKIAQEAWTEYVWNLTTPRRLEAERRGLNNMMSPDARPTGLPDREASSQYTISKTTPLQDPNKHEDPGQIPDQTQNAPFRVIAGTPSTIRRYLDEYLTTGANYFVCAFQFGNMKSSVANKSIDLFLNDVMPYYQSSNMKYPI